MPLSCPKNIEKIMKESLTYYVPYVPYMEISISSKKYLHFFTLSLFCKTQQKKTQNANDARMVQGWFKDGSRLVQGWFKDGSLLLF